MIVVSAERGNVVVVMNTNDYVEIVRKILKHPTYKKSIGNLVWRSSVPEKQ